MGDLTIRVLEARNLIPADRNGKSDPYTTVEILEDPMQKKQKTHCHHKTLNPVWQETFNFRAPTMNSTILFKVWDRDLFKKNDPLGNVSVLVNRLTPGAPNNFWLDLQGVPTGQLHVEIIFVPSVQAGGAPRTGQYPQQTNQVPPQYPPTQGYPPQQQQQGYPPQPGQRPYYPPSNNFPQQNYPPQNPTQSYPQQAPPPNYPPQNPTQSYPPQNYPPQNNPTQSYPPQANRNVGSGYPPSNYPAGPAGPAGLAGPGPAGPAPAAYASQPTNSYNAPSRQDEDVGVDYSKLASDFSMQTPYGSQQPQQPPYASQPQQPPYASQPQQQPPYASQPQQQPPYASQGQYPAQGQYAPGQQPPYASQPGYPPQNFPQQNAYGSQPGYPPQQQQQQQAYGSQGAPLTNAQGLVTGPTLTKFFVHIKKRLNRDYIVIMDMSGSMSGRKWEQAKDATMKIAPFACQADPDGITLYLFNGHFKSYQNLTQATQVQQIFMREKPSGTTDLAGVLGAAFREHFSGNKPTTILVITDGEPDSQAATTREIVQAAGRIKSQEDLSISFIQIGDDRSATKFLKFLDDNLTPLGAKFDIVDTVSASDLGAMSFEQLIEKSIYD